MDRLYLDAKDLDLICNSLFDDICGVDHYIAMCVRVMYITGCRPSECVGFNRHFKIDGKKIILQPLKDNSLRYFEVKDELYLFPFKQLEGWSELNIVSLSSLERTIRAFNRLGVIYLKDKTLVSNIFRHNYVKKKHHQGYSDRDVKKILGHKNILNTYSYLNSKPYVSTHKKPALNKLRHNFVE